MASTSETEPALHPHQPVLTPALSDRWMLGLEHVVITAVGAMSFLFLNFFPLRPSDLWGHVLYGQWILEHRALPTEDPFLPLAVGMPVVDSAWGSQVIFALVDQFGGVEGLSLLFAITVLATYAVLMRVFYLQSSALGRPARVLVALGMSLAAAYIGWSRMATIRPENFAILLFAVLLWLLMGDEASASSSARRYRGLSLRLWIGVPVLFAVWANLHGSFICGLAVLGCWFLGAFLETAWRERSLAAAVSNRTVQGWLILGELATLATCLNPYGPNLLLNVFLFANNENLKQLLEWQPLAILGVGGRGFALSWILLLVVMRFSRAKLKLAHVLVFAVYTVAAVASIRMLGWYAPVVCLLITPHAADIVARWLRRWEASLPPLAEDEVATEGLLGLGYSFQFSLACLGVILICFSFSEASNRVYRRKPMSLTLRLGKETPISLIAYLEKHPKLLEATSFCPQTWGEWLRMNLGESFRPFMTSNVHLAPKQVWDDYNFITAVQPGWQRVMDRYRLEVAIVDLVQQPGLAKVLRKDDNWQLLYEDEQALVLQKRTRGTSAATASASAPKKSSGKNDLEITLPGSEDNAPPKPSAATPAAAAPAPPAAPKAEAKP